MKPIIRPRHLLAFLAIAGASPSFAQNGNSESDSTGGGDKMYAMTLNDLLGLEVVTASMYSQKQTDVPASLVVLTKKQLQSYNIKDLSDVMKILPGVDITDNAGRFGELYTINGIEGNDRFLVLINGRKLNAPSGVFLSVGNSISVQFADRIEIIYGPASVMYGADAFSMVINIISDEKPEKIQANADLNYGSFNTEDLYADVAIPVGDKFSLKMAGKWYGSKGFAFTGPGYVIIDKYQAPLRPAFEQPINDHNVSVEARYGKISAGYFRQRFSEGNSRALVPASYIMNKEGVWASNQNIAWANYKTELPGNAGTISADFSHIRYNQEPESRFYKLATPGNTSQSFSQYMTGRDISYKGVLTYTKSVRSVLDILAGVQYENTSSIPHYANDDLLGKPSKFEGAVADQLKAERTVNEQKIGLFSQAVWKPSSKINVSAGLRFDHSKLFDETINPRFAVIYKPVEKTAVKIIFGTAFQAPSLYYQYEQFGTPGIVMIPSPQQDFKLKNQKVKSGELNITQNVSSKLTFDLSVFYNATSDLIDRRLYTQSVWNKYFNKMTPGLRNENVGTGYSYGARLSARGVFGDFSFYGNYTFTEAMQGNAGSEKVQLARVAPHKLFLSGTFTKKYFQITPSLKFVDKIYAPQASVLYADDKIAPGYTNLALGVFFTNLIPKTRINISIDNMLNSKINHVGIFNSANYSDALPQPGFNFKAGVLVSL